MVRGPARLQHHRAGGLRLEKPDHLAPAQRAPDLGLPGLVHPCTWNTALAVSRPIMVTLIADGSFCGALNSPQSGTPMPSGAVHPISGGSLRDGIERRLTKPYHPWTHGQAERMNRTVKASSRRAGAIKAFRYPDLEAPQAHVLAFVMPATSPSTSRPCAGGHPCGPPATPQPGTNIWAGDVRRLTVVNKSGLLGSRRRAKPNRSASASMPSFSASTLPQTSLIPRARA